MAANQKILDAVYDYIASPGNPALRKKPIGGTLTVTAPTPVTVSYRGKVQLSQGADREYVLSEFKARLGSYYEEAKKDGMLRFIKLTAILGSISGIDDYDYGLFTVNGKQENIPIAEDEYPVTGALLLEYEAGGFL